jgi:hypothetical protein
VHQDFAQFLSVFTVETVRVLDYFNGFFDDVGTVSVDLC